MTARKPDAKRSGRVLGRSVPRLEDAPLLVGRGRFVDDINFPDQLHMRVVRSQHAHGDIVAIDADAARAMPGVVAVWTGEDLRDLPPIDFRDPAPKELQPYRQPALAQHRVRYVGEPVAAVFAEHAYIAEDAAALVGIEIDELPALLAASEEPREFADGLSTEPVTLKSSYGDLDAAFASAAHSFELELSIGRHSGTPL